MAAAVSASRASLAVRAIVFVSIPFAANPLALAVGKISGSARAVRSALGVTGGRGSLVWEFSAAVSLGRVRRRNYFRGS